jgi:hypothetical protein
MSGFVKNKWVGLSAFFVAVMLYLILDILDTAGLARQVAIFPMCFLERLVCSLAGIGGLLELDIDISGTWATYIRVLSFGIELATVLLPAYFYKKTNKKIYLILMLCAIVWIIIGLGYFLVILFSISGMMD